MMDTCQRASVTFSLILATLNRASEIKLCLDSLKEQSYQRFEVIIVDQSTDDKTAALVQSADYQDLRIKYHHVDFKGLSKARNYALQRADGDFFCLIDDDAYYPSDYLQRVLLHAGQCKDRTIFTGYMWDSIKEKPFVRYDYLKDGEPLSIRQIIRYCPSPCVTFPMGIVKEIGLFDERFGVGAEYGASEETDLILRGQKAGYCVKYFRDIEIEHPHKALRQTSSITGEKKVYQYARGFGALVRKYTKSNGIFTRVLLCFAESFCRDLVKLLLRRPYAKNALLGKLNGWKTYRGN